jgi:serine protease Do
VKLPWLGVDGQAVTADLAASLSIPVPNGVLLRSVYPGGPADRAGLHVGDVIFTVDDQPVGDMQSLNYRIATHKPGDVVKMHVHLGKQAAEVWATLGLPPETPPRDVQTVGGRNPLTGAKVENLSPAVATELQLPLTAKGVVVLSVTAGTPSGSYGFQPGDIVLGINGEAITSVNDLQRTLSAAQSWQMIVNRGGQRLALNVQG